jgi:hypothetical protein
MIMLRVNEQAEDFYDKSQELGTLAANAFFGIQGRERDKHRSQMTGLENIAETTWKATDVLDYIKKQMARERSGWTTTHQFGEKLKQYIENGLTPAIDAVCDSVGIGNATEEDRRDRQRIRLELIRQMIRQVVVQFEYQVNESENNNPK